MRSAWALLLFVVQALSLPHNYHDGPNQLQTLTFALDDLDLEGLSNVEKFDRILRCSEYFTMMFQNAKRNNNNYNYNYYSPPVQPKTGKSKITGVDSFESTNQIIMSKEQDNAACELIWTSYQNLMGGDIYNEINNADDLANWLTVLLSDDNGKQKTYKVMPANYYGWNTIDSDAEEALTNNMKSMKKVLKGAGKNTGKRSAGAKDATLKRRRRGEGPKGKPESMDEISSMLMKMISSTQTMGSMVGGPLIDMSDSKEKRDISSILRRVARTGKGEGEKKEDPKEKEQKGKKPGGGKSLDMGDLWQWLQTMMDFSTNNMSGTNIGKRSLSDLTEELVNRLKRSLHTFAMGAASKINRRRRSDEDESGGGGEVGNDSSSDDDDLTIIINNSNDDQKNESDEDEMEEWMKKMMMMKTESTTTEEPTTESTTPSTMPTTESTTPSTMPTTESTTPSTMPTTPTTTPTPGTPFTLGDLLDAINDAIGEELNISDKIDALKILLTELALIDTDLSGLVDILRALDPTLSSLLDGLIPFLESEVGPLLSGLSVDNVVSDLLDTVSGLLTGKRRRSITDGTELNAISRFERSPEVLLSSLYPGLETLLDRLGLTETGTALTDLLDILGLSGTDLQGLQDIITQINPAIVEIILLVYLIVYQLQLNPLLVSLGLGPLISYLLDFIASLLFVKRKRSVIEEMGGMGFDRFKRSDEYDENIDMLLNSLRKKRGTSSQFLDETNANRKKRDPTKDYASGEPWFVQQWKRSIDEMEISDSKSKREVLNENYASFESNDRKRRANAPSGDLFAAGEVNRIERNARPDDIEELDKVKRSPADGMDMMKKEKREEWADEYDFRKRREPIVNDVNQVASAEGMKKRSINEPDSEGLRRRRAPHNHKNKNQSQSQGDQEGGGEENGVNDSEDGDRKRRDSFEKVMNQLFRRSADSRTL